MNHPLQAGGLNLLGSNRFTSKNILAHKEFFIFFFQKSLTSSGWVSLLEAAKYHSLIDARLLHLCDPISSQ